MGNAVATGTATAAKTVLRRYFEDAWGRGDLSVLDELIAPEVAVHSQYAHVEVLPPPGPQACRDEIGLYRRTFPDLKVEVKDQVADGDRVMTLWEATGTHRGELLGVPPTGRRVRITSLYFAEVADGRISRTRNTWDALSLYQQLGLTPRTMPYRNSADPGAWPHHPDTLPHSPHPDPAKRLVQRLFEEVYAGVPGSAEEVLHPGYRSAENLAAPVVGGPALLTARHAELCRAAPGARAVLDAVISEGDQAAYCWTVHAATPQGQPFSLMVSTLARLRDGRIAETAHRYDALPFLHATGQEPPAAGEARLLG
ncbi:ester cyclase [Streptomyces vietnamensis]|uniref:ester cyclase n=1 Tax=Streptomyces vietnamensis TaxID=362257 RepID=UPI003441E637